MSGTRQPSLQELISRRYVRDRGCLRKLVAHSALYRQLQSGTPKLHSPPSNKPPAPPRLVKEDTALDMLIESLILDDLNEEQGAMSRARSEHE